MASFGEEVLCGRRVLVRAIGAKAASFGGTALGARWVASQMVGTSYDTI